MDNSLFRCMGGRYCTHVPGTCTATNKDYQEAAKAGRAPAEADADEGMPYLIWSNQHRMWWGRGRWGYTPDIAIAGRYSRKQAIEIVAEAREGLLPGSNFPEIAVREDDALEALS